jgi:hypothetical protein
MTDAIGSLLHLLFTSLGLITAVDPGTVTIYAAAVLAAALIVTLLCAITLPRSARASLAHARRAIDASAPVSQSDPDAEGHPRSRAPGFAASAA